MKKKGIMSALQRLHDGWDYRYELFATGNALYLIEVSTGEVISRYWIPNDGGDPDFEERDRKEYLVR